jgi:nucleoside-diphosphate-sugar epimerase
MRVLFTGASSPLGAQVLAGLLPLEQYSEIWVAIHRRAPLITHPKVKFVKIHLENNELNLNEIPAPLDLVIHFAAVTHAKDVEAYSKVNFSGTMHLAQAVRALGCRRFVHISTRCATEGSGAYGESKLAAERGLLSLEWDRLLILRPSEIYGSFSGEGIDQLLALASRFHVVPLLWGHKGLRFAPLKTADFVTVATSLIQMNQEGVQVFDLCGPEDLKASDLALRIAAKYRALPIPVWWPCLVVSLRILGFFGLRLIAPDQLERLVGKKTASRSTPNLAVSGVTSRFLEP